MSNSVQNIENLISSISSLTVLELAELTKALETKFGVTAAMPMASGASSASAEVAAPVEEKTEFKVELMDAGAEKIKTIKALRKVKKDLGLTEAKTMVDSAPVVVAEGVSKADAKMMQDELEAAGAKVKVS
jgi:large subunit ribosomal protein L7/L12